MTTLEYMEKQLNKHQKVLEREIKRDAPEEQIENIKKKIGHYEEACDILKEKQS